MDSRGWCSEKTTCMVGEGGLVLAECMYGGGQCSESAGMVGGGVLIRVDAW